MTSPCGPLDEVGLTPELIAHVKRWEGWRAAPYLCPAGIPTIGYGHVIPSLNTPPISQEEGEVMLRADLKVARQGALHYSPTLVHASPRRLAAVIDFCFNLGAGRYGTSTFRKRVEAGDWDGAAVQNDRWVYAGKVKLPGLVARRAATSVWLREG